MGGSELFFEAEERGSKVVIRRRAPHYTGLGEIIARRVEMSDAQDIVKAVNMHQELVEALQLARFAVLGYIDRCDYSRGREVLLKMQTALANAGIDTSKWYIPTAALDELRKSVDEVRE